MTTDIQPASGAGAVRPAIGMLRSFAIFVLLPTLAAAIYFGLVSSDRYVAEARYAIRSGAGSPAGGLIESVLSTGGGGGSTRQNAEIVRSYVFSHDMLAELGNRFDLRTHYGSAEIDWLSRFDKDASDEEFLEYLGRMFEVTIDPESSISTLRVVAFDAESARAIADHLLGLSEQLVNTLSERVIVDTLRFARDELDRTEDQVLVATTALTDFRKQTRSIDPGEETAAVLSIVTDLETRLATARIELIETRSVMQNDSMQVRGLETRVAALSNQVAQERNRLANGHDGDLTSLIDRYQPLLLEQELAMQRYSSALISLEVSRAEAQRQQSYLIAFVSPQVPDEATEPRRGWLIATVFGSSFLIYAIGALVWSSIKDHAGL